MTVVTEPGIYEIPEGEYHADKALAPELGRSLSVSGAKKILTCPALFAYERDHGQAPRDAFEFGTVAHTLILGKGGDIAVIAADDWRSKSARDERDAARVDGLTPILHTEYAKANAVADAVHAHPVAAAILEQGEAEKSLYWQDAETSVTRRGRTDWLRDNAIVDVKTCADASPAGFAKACGTFGYDMQAAWYTDGVEALTGERLPFLFIAVEKTAPHLVAVYQLDDFALERGANRNREALRIYAECESSGVWPGYSTDIETLSLPRWAN